MLSPKWGNGIIKIQQGYEGEVIYLIVPWSRRFFVLVGIYLNGTVTEGGKNGYNFKCFHVNIKSRDDVLSLRPFREPSSPPPPQMFSVFLRTVCPSFCPARIVLCWIYTDANSPVDVQLWAPSPERLPFFFFLPPSYHPQHYTPPPPSLLPPPAALLPILGDLGAVLKVPHTPEAVSGPLPSHERNTQ